VLHNFLRADIFKAEGFATYSAVPLIAKGEVKGILEVFQRSQGEQGLEWVEFLETLAGQVTIAIDNSQLFTNLQRSNLELSLAYDATIEGWSRALDMRDSETEGHTKRVTEMALSLARVMGMSESDLVHMRRGILLHDMGKMGIPDTILLKPDALSEEEWKVMHMHPQYAFEMLAPISYLRPALDIPGSHHEKWDGTGYPRGLKGEQIPLAARIFTVVDVYDALTSDRPYRKAWTSQKALQYIIEEKGKFFDPRVVDVFLSMKQEIGLTDNGELK
jgi:HD-GYP domain-containing protein (c-di-GMP phosphodiesterase class II)